jgi:hypothetical protein
MKRTAWSFVGTFWPSVASAPRPVDHPTATRNSVRQVSYQVSGRQVFA